MTQTDAKMVGDLDRKQIHKAVEALLKLDVVKHKNDLFSDTDARKINLQFSFARAAAIKQQTIKISLPHSLHQETTEVCLFVKDMEKKKRDYEPTVDHFEGLLKEKDVTCVSEVIPLMSLKTEYKPFEAKKNLSNRFDVFLADDSIIRLLPNYLGKNFYGRKKAPVQVNLRATDLKGEITKAIANTRCHLTGRGTCGMVTCAYSSMTIEHIADNIVAAIGKLAAAVPGGAGNLKTFNIKTIDSESIPLMVTMKSPDNVALPVSQDQDSDSEPEDVTTIEDGKVKVTKSGEIILINDDGTKINLTKFEEEELEETTEKREKTTRATKRKRAVGKKAGPAGPQIKKAKTLKKTKTLKQPKSMKKTKKA